MKAIVSKTDKKILGASEATTFGGPWASMIEAGTVVLLDVPSNEDLSDCDVNDTVTSIVVNAARKQARLAKSQQLENWLEKLRTIKKSDLDTLDKCSDAIVDLAKVMRRWLKGD